MCTSTQLAQWYSHIPYRCDGTLTTKVYQHSISIYAGHQLRRFSKNPKNNKKPRHRCSMQVVHPCSTHNPWRQKANKSGKKNGCKGGCNKSINRCIAAFQIVPFLFLFLWSCWDMLKLELHCYLVSFPQGLYASHSIIIYSCHMSFPPVAERLNCIYLLLGLLCFVSK